MLTSGVIKACFNECNKSTYKFHVGCVIFSNGGRIISTGHNGIRSTSQIKNKFKKWHNSLHAEQAALMNLDWTKVSGCAILIMKLSKTDHKLSNAKPCPMCQAILEHVGIRKIYYSNEEGEIVKLEK